MMISEPPLSPAQQRALDDLLLALDAGDVALLSATPGTGQTTVLRAAYQARGGTLLTLTDVMRAMSGRHPLALEEGLYELVAGAVATSDIVFIDDLHMVAAAVCCGTYPRMQFMNAAFAALAADAAAAGTKLAAVASGGGSHVLGALYARAHRTHIAPYAAADYAHLLRAFLGPERAAALDVEKVHRFAPKLTAHQLRTSCEWLTRSSGGAALDTDAFLEYLRSRHLASNVDLGEVQAVELRELKGVDDVLAALEANVIIPLENAELAAELELRPKRGVLLAGPPGTGKTTIGRALAHRLRSKFFLIDGTFISGTGAFYQRVHEVFEAATRNAPSIVFIDDSDVIFQNGEELGLYRYLLTMLDGLESKSVGRVCVMMTAMDVANLPPALIRSGRIELWLETRLPDEPARQAILAERLAALPPAMGRGDAGRIAAASEGLTGADLKRLVEDAKVLYAYDRARGQAPREVTDYLLAATEAVRANKARYEQAEAQARARHPNRPSIFDMIGGLASAGMMTPDGEGANFLYAIEGGAMPTSLTVRDEG